MNQVESFAETNDIPERTILLTKSRVLRTSRCP